MTITMTKGRWGFVGIILLVAMLVIWKSWPTPPPPVDTAKLIREAEAKLTAEYTQRLQISANAYRDIESRLSVSEAKNKVLAQTIVDLKKKKDEIKTPETDADLRARFTALGFPPLPAK